jgi:uncharacterized protein
MNEILPLAPQAGLSESAFLWISLAIGGFFGFFLEKAGFSTSKNLTSIFILRDFRVFRVMFTAVLTAMIGSQLLHHTGIINLGFVGFDATFLWPMLLGGLVFGVGFYVGGFCPGTAAVALVRGRWDASAFLFGIVLGIYGFALLYDAVGATAWFSEFYAPATATRQTLYGGGAAWPWVLGITLVAFAGFKAVPWVERKFALKTVEELAQEKESGQPIKRDPPQPSSWVWRWAAPTATLILVAALIGVETQTDYPILVRDSSREAAMALESQEDALLDGPTLAGWLIDNGYKLADEKPAAMYLFDLRSEQRRRELPMRFAETIDAADASLIGYLRERIPKPERAKPLVFIGEDTESVERLVRELREHNFRAFALEGGEDGWRSQVLEAPVANMAGAVNIGDTLARVKS